MQYIIVLDLFVPVSGLLYLLCSDGYLSKQINNMDVIKYRGVHFID